MKNETLFQIMNQSLDTSQSLKVNVVLVMEFEENKEN